MSTKVEKIREIIAEIESIKLSAQSLEKDFAPYLQKVHPKWLESARNLVHYRALRNHDLRELQKKLGNLGLSRLAKAEGHVMASLDANLQMLKALIGEKAQESASAIGIEESIKILSNHRKALFGARTPGRQVRIMVTQPSNAAENPNLVASMIAAGMNTLRINCAHDGPQEWLAMIAHARQAMLRSNQICKISMDLGGPKIRTGSMVPGPKVIHLRPPRNNFGHIIASVPVTLVPNDYATGNRDATYVPVEMEWLQQLRQGSVIEMVDTRGKNRSIKVVKVDDKMVLAEAYDSTFIATGTVLYIAGSENSTRVGELPMLEEFILLKTGDHLLIHKENRLGEPAKYDEAGQLLQVAHVSCTSSEIFAKVEVGETILFDDGKIAGKIISANDYEIRVEVTYAKEKGTKLKADKGINLPGSKLSISGLTPKDKEDLAFVATNADVVNMSFVNSKQDVEDLITETRAFGAENKLGIILKIETRAGFQNLVEILLTAMQLYPVGVMIARGDLAIECGWQNIGRVQEEILWLCQAAHIPTVWATQVFENLAKKGIPSRAEITDAVMSQRADCVMLNKGPFIVEAIAMLDQILKNMQNYQEKKAPMLPPLQMNFGE